MAPTKKLATANKPKMGARQACQLEARMSEDIDEVSSGDDLILQKNSSNKNGKRPQIIETMEVEPRKARAKKVKNQQTSPAEADQVVLTDSARGTWADVQHDGTLQPHPTAIELVQRVSRLLSQEPDPSTAAHHQTYIRNLDQRLPIEDQALAVKDKQIEILEEKLRRLQAELTQLRDAGKGKDKLFEEYRRIRETEPERQLLRLETETKTALATKESIIASQAQEIVKSQRIITELHAKLVRISSGEEDQIQELLKQERQDLTQRLEELQVAFDQQRRRRKEAERQLKHARLAAEEDVQKRVEELQIEANTNRKMLEEETNHSKGLIAQLNQLRGLTGHNGRNGGSASCNLNSNALASRTAAGGAESTEEVKARLTLLEDLTGFQILSSGKNNKGKTFDCLFTDLKSAKYTLSFKLSHHLDDSYSYEPSLDPARDYETIKILPEFFPTFMRFDKDSSGQFFLKLFRAFNEDHCS